MTRMTLRQLNRFLNQMPTITAKEQVGDAAVASVPHMTEESRVEIVGAWREIAGIAEGKNEHLDRITFDEFTKEIGQGIIGG